MNNLSEFLIQSPKASNLLNQTPISIPGRDWLTSGLDCLLLYSLGLILVSLLFLSSRFTEFKFSTAVNSLINSLRK